MTIQIIVKGRNDVRAYRNGLLVAKAFRADDQSTWFLGKAYSQVNEDQEIVTTFKVVGEITPVLREVEQRKAIAAVLKVIA